MKLLLLLMLCCCSLWVSAKDYTYIINRKGQKVTTIDLKKYEPVRAGNKNRFSEGLLAVYDISTNKVGYIDHNGNVIIDCIFDNGYPFSEGRAFVDISSIKKHPTNEYNFGYINKLGQIVIEGVDGNSSSFKEGLAYTPLYDGKSYIFIDSLGKEVLVLKNTPQLSLEYDLGNNSYFTEGLLLSENNNIFLDKNLEILLNINEKYFFSSGFHEGYALVKTNKLKDYFCDIRGRLFFPQEKLTFFSEGLAAFRKNNKYGFIDHSGEVVIPAIYDEVGSFSEGLAWVIRRTPEGKYEIGFINHDGMIVIPFWDWTNGAYVSGFHEGKCLVFYDAFVN